MLVLRSELLLSLLGRWIEMLKLWEVRVEHSGLSFSISSGRL